MIVLGNQNQLPSSFAHLGDLLKALMFLSNLNGFNSSPSPPNQEFAKRKGSSKVWKEKDSKWFCHLFSLSPSCFCFCITCVLCFHVLSQSSFMHWFVLFNMFLFGYLLVLLDFVFHIKIKKNNNEKSEKYKNSVCLCTLVLVYLGWPLKQSFLNFVSFVA